MRAQSRVQPSRDWPNFGPEGGGGTQAMSARAHSCDFYDVLHVTCMSFGAGLSTSEFRNGSYHRTAKTIIASARPWYLHHYISVCAAVARYIFTLCVYVCVFWRSCEAHVCRRIFTSKRPALPMLVTQYWASTSTDRDETWCFPGGGSSVRRCRFEKGWRLCAGVHCFRLCC